MIHQGLFNIHPLFGFRGLGFGAGFRAPCSQAEIEFLFDGLDVNQIDYLYEAKKG